MSRSFYPLFTSRSYKVQLKCKSLIHFDFLFMNGVSVPCNSPACGHTVFHETFVEEIFFPLRILGTIIEDQLNLYMWVYFQGILFYPILCSAMLCCAFLPHSHGVAMKTTPLCRGVGGEKHWKARPAEGQLEIRIKGSET